MHHDSERPKLCPDCERLVADYERTRALAAALTGTTVSLAACTPPPAEESSALEEVSVVDGAADARHDDRVAQLIRALQSGSDIPSPAELVRSPLALPPSPRIDTPRVGRDGAMRGRSSRSHTPVERDLSVVIAQRAREVDRAEQRVHERLDAVAEAERQIKRDRKAMALRQAKLETAFIVLHRREEAVAKGEDDLRKAVKAAKHRHGNEARVAAHHARALGDASGRYATPPRTTGMTPLLSPRTPRSPAAAALFASPARRDTPSNMTQDDARRVVRDLRECATHLTMCAGELDAIPGANQRIVQQALAVATGQLAYLRDLDDADRGAVPAFEML